MTGYKTVVGMVNGMMEEMKITVPVALHLDHGSYEGCLKCLHFLCHGQDCLCPLQIVDIELTYCIMTCLCLLCAWEKSGTMCDKPLHVSGENGLSLVSGKGYGAIVTRILSKREQEIWSMLIIMPSIMAFTILYMSADLHRIISIPHAAGFLPTDEQGIIRRGT